MSIRHPSRRRSVIALALLAAVLIAMGAVALGYRESSSTQVQPTPRPTPAVDSLDDDPTLLVQLRQDRFRNVGNVIVALQPEDTGAQLYLPADTVLRAVGAGQQTLSDTGIMPIQDGPELVTQQTAVRVDGAIVLDRLAFAGLVDAVGGITVDIPQTIAFVDRFGTTSAVLPAGPQSLDGPEAALYATYDRPGASSDQYFRFQQVWDALLRQLPEEPERMRAILGSLGALARSTQSIGPLGEFFAQAGAAARGEGWRSASIYVRPGGFGPQPLSYVDPGLSYLQVQQLFGSAVMAPQRPPVRVRVYAAGAAPREVSELTGDSPEGLQFVWSGPADVQALSRVVVVDAVYTALAKRVAVAAGLFPAVVSIDPDATPGAPISLYYAGPQRLQSPDADTDDADVGPS